MAIHICRDFLTLAGSTFPKTNLYLVTLFLYGTLGFTQVGQTGFTGYQLGLGVSGSINMGVGNELAVALPTSSYVVSTSDVNRILVLRSDVNPRFNSGLFRITSVNTSSNWVFIDYRSSDNPPAETNTLTWHVFKDESTFTVSGGENGSVSVGHYHSYGSATCNRIVLQSPHTSSWQVRLCYEGTVNDRFSGSVAFTIAPGISGTVAGDFASGSYDTSAPGGEHLHGPLWFDVSSQLYRGSVVGFDCVLGNSMADSAGAQVRFYAWGDSVSGSAVFVDRNVTSANDAWAAMGMCEDEETPLPPKTAQRLFAFGKASDQNTTPNIWWNNGPAAVRNANTAVAFGLRNKPVSCVLSPYQFIGGVPTGQSAATSPRSSPNAADAWLLNATEVYGVEVYAGTEETGNTYSLWPTSAIFEYDPRRMGRFPIARAGRENHTVWSTSSDVNKQWFHAKNGVFFPWSGPAVLA